MKELEDRVGLSAEIREAIEAAIAEHHILQDVARWRTIAAVIVQDEYTHDVVVPWDEQPGASPSSGLFLVYDAT